MGSFGLTTDDGLTANPGTIVSLALLVAQEKYPGSISGLWRLYREDPNFHDSQATSW